ncbi:DNA (cytosine-5-)-methyltransferase [Mycoplasmopsis phocirhinis]|uniref:DNA (cytosine-5-)-methyltransferase n=2 Tax=Mycoplasmopsis phocirhinis TaxID=142650 RepID=A0A4P6MTE8_9BACT|nr:DNA (cytosine-5-)-methyltransferase [Mycoplasmopsis phocirhinis]
MDFCSGIGGGRLGLQNNGLECVGHSEIDLDAQNTYNIIFGLGKNYGDLMQIDIDKLPDFDFMIGGFPCQSFSIAGKRKGFEDYRGTIIYGLIDILFKKKIKYFLFENVKGLLNHNKGQTLKIIIEKLQSANYNVYTQVLNSKDFGVAQKRERIYIVGIRKDIDNLKFNFPQPKSIKYKFNDFIDPENNLIFDHNNSTFKKYLANKYNQNKYSIDFILGLNNTVIDTRQSDLRIYKEIFPTLRTGRHGLLYVKNGIIKKLNSYEALMLQGFPKNICTKIKKHYNINENKILSQCGNAMTVSVIEAIVREMKKVF